MLYDDYYSEFSDSFAQKDLQGANNALMKELGNILVRKRIDFVDLLNESGIAATVDMSDLKLVDLFIENAPFNRNLIIGASMLVNQHNKQLGFDGEDEISDDGVKAVYVTLTSYFSGDDEESNAEGKAKKSKEGGGGAGILGSIAGIVQGGSQVATKVMEGQQKQKFGALDLVSKQQDAKAAMSQQIVAQRQLQMEAAQKQKEQRAKTIKISLIVGGVVVGLGLIGLTVYLIKKNK